MAEAKLIEMMDAAYWEAFDSFNGKTSEDAMRAALSVLARPQNVSDAMVEAFCADFDPRPDEEFTETYRRALAAAISAAGDEDRRA